jgi:2-(1,2-epoxy-1,2-dihydrophenyl)acetyl-CoA isomerase
MSAVLLELDGGVAWIRLNRPEQGNAIDMAMAEQLAAAAATAAADPAIRCVALTGTGRMFCVGGDIAAFASAGGQAGAFLRELADTLHGAVRTLAEMAKPLVVLVDGPAAGAGLSLALLGDIVLASGQASFIAAYTGIGLTPDGGLSWLLQRLVGLRRTQEMLLTNRRISAEEAEAIGLVTRHVVGEALAAEGQAAIAGLLAAPTAALGATRSLLLAGATATLAEQLEREATQISAAGAGPESREGISAYLARRKPDFKGSSHG